MMKEKGFSRRNFLRLASAAPFALTLGCGGEAYADLEAEDALRILILAIGPWGEDRRSQADKFVTRFIPASTVSGSFLAQGETLKHLVNRKLFRDRPMALQSLDLGQYSDTEKDLLTSLTARIYSLYEVHYHHVGGMPDAGICGGREWYQGSPSEW
jgi:hypothetical protein